MCSRPPIFLCDEMLKGLARWLRAAGYDTLICDDGERDRHLLDRAQSAGRLLLTRDHKLQEFRGADGTVVYLRCNRLDSCAQELTETINLDWTYRPFSRCLLCNTPLQPGSIENRLQVPESSRKYATQVYYCRCCDKVYWNGSHTTRMRARLVAWQNRQVVDIPIAEAIDQYSAVEADGVLVHTARGLGISLGDG